jgi:hypothetical protein
LYVDDSGTGLNADLFIYSACFDVDAAVLTEVAEHGEPDRLSALKRAVFEFAAPRTGDPLAGQRLTELTVAV